MIANESAARKDAKHDFALNILILGFGYLEHLVRIFEYILILGFGYLEHQVRTYLFVQAEFDQCFDSPDRNFDLGYGEI